MHDSDGLSIQLGDGEWIWRPLVNPRRLLVTSFSATNPRGFGLMQRDRSPASYEDPEALYERRPSAWIEPVGNWGAGPGRAGADPDARTRPTTTSSPSGCRRLTPAPGKPLDIAYRIRWQGAGTVPAGKGWVVQTRRGRGFAKASPTATSITSSTSTARRCARWRHGDDVEPVIWVDANAEVRERNLFKNPVSGAWRMTVRFKRNDAAKPVELRAYLKQQQTTLTETWSYILPAEADKP